MTVDEEEMGARAPHICDRPHLSRGDAAASYVRRWWAGMMYILYNMLGIPFVNDGRDSPRPIFPRQDVGDAEHCALMVWGALPFLHRQEEGDGHAIYAHMQFEVCILYFKYNNTISLQL